MNAAPPALDEVVLGCASAALVRLGLVVDAAGVARVGGVRLRATGEGGGIRDLVRGTVDAVDGQDAAADPVGPIGAVALDHVVVLTGDVNATAERYGGARRTEVRDGRRYAYVVAGPALIEVVGPADPDGRNARPWGLALAVADLAVAAAHLGDALGAPRPAHQPGRTIATVRHEQLDLGVPTVLLTPRHTS